MESAEGQGFGRFGGFLLAVSLILPYFALSIAGFTGMNFSLWRLDRAAFVMVSIYAVIALAQVRFSNRETRAMIYMIVGGLFTAALVYRLWISPPGSAPIGDLGENGKLSINGKEAAGSISTKDFLEALGVKLKVSYGAYLAMVGSVFFTVGAFLDWRASGSQPAGNSYDAQLQHIQQVAAPQQQAYVPPAQPTDVYTPPPSDPFAAPAGQVPTDPFAVPATAPPQLPQPSAPNAAPQRPPGC